MAVKILLTGSPGVGKTTILENVLQILLAQNKKVMGCLVKEERFKGKRERFHIHYIPDNKTTVLASHLEKLSDFFVSRFSVNTRALKEELFPFMDKMVQSSIDTTLIFDEIGRMQKGGTPQGDSKKDESLSHEFLKKVDQLFASPHNMIATILYDDEEWTHKYKNYPHVKVITVTQDNRDSIVPSVMKLLEPHS